MIYSKLFLNQLFCLDEPSQKQKFGAFAGVFTPILLTILGVIMYMRLGWVVGHAGLYNTLFIILLAHVISFTTGLSVSSIATDKRLRPEAYTMFFEPQFGPSHWWCHWHCPGNRNSAQHMLYLIGFAESFLSIDYIREFSGLESSINSYRIIGTLAILLLVIIAYINTSFALRTQFYILGAVLSLVSIAHRYFNANRLSGSFGDASPAEDGLPFGLLFAVFFLPLPGLRPALPCRAI